MELATAEVPKVWGTNKVAANQELIDFIVRIIPLNIKPFNDVTIEEGRAQMRALFAVCMKPRDYDGTIEDRKVPSPHTKDGLLVRVYTPATLPEDPVILVYFHGGGHIYGHIDDLASTHKALSTLCECIIVDVDYRLAPEAKFPASMDDCVTATEWVLQNKQSLGGTDHSPVGISGDSAGGQSTLYVAQTVKGLDFQIPVYPWTDMACKLASLVEFADGPLTTKAGCEWAVDILLNKDESRDDPRWSCVYQKDFTNVPPTLMILAEIDAIRDDGREYAKKLIDAGVSVSVLEVKGTTHIFFTLPDHFVEATNDAYGKINNFLQWIKHVKKQNKK